MRYREFLELIEQKTGIKPTHARISEILGGRPTPNALGNRFFNNGFLKIEELKILLNHYKLSNEYIDNINMIVDNNNENLSGKFVKIPYWNGCPQCSGKIKKSGVTEFCIDLQIVINEWGAVPDNLRIIAMNGEEMNGGNYPIKNKDLLVIDISRTDLTESGIFFASSHNCSKIYVRRIIEYLDNDYSYLTTVDNPYWTNRLEKTWSKKNWIDTDIKIIGRVIKNLSFKI